MAEDTVEAATARLNRYAGQRAKVDSALLAVGINRRTAADNIDKASKIAADLGASIVAKCIRQAVYDNYTNVPEGIINASDYAPSESVMRGLPGAIGTFLEWDVTAALELCADILEDVNAHDEAAKVRAMMGA